MPRRIVWICLFFALSSLQAWAQDDVGRHSPDPSRDIARYIQADTAVKPDRKSAPNKAQQRGLPLTPRNLVIMVSGIAMFGVTILGVNAYQRRQTSLSVRFACNLAVAFPSSDDATQLITARAEDISRRGIKIRAEPDVMPPLKGQVTLQIEGHEKKVNVRWRNAYFFGGEFVTPFSAKETARIGRNAKADLAQTFADD